MNNLVLTDWTVISLNGRFRDFHVNTKGFACGYKLSYFLVYSFVYRNILKLTRQYLDIPSNQNQNIYNRFPNDILILIFYTRNKTK